MQDKWFIRTVMARAKPHVSFHALKKDKKWKGKSSTQLLLNSRDLKGLKAGKSRSSPKIKEGAVLPKTAFGVRPKDPQFNKHFQQILSKARDILKLPQNRLFLESVPKKIQKMKNHRRTSTKEKQRINNWLKSHPIFFFFSKSEVASKSSKQIDEGGNLIPSSFRYIWAQGMWIVGEKSISVCLYVLLHSQVSAVAFSKGVSASLAMRSGTFWSLSEVLPLQSKHSENSSFWLKWFSWRSQKRARRVSCSACAPLWGIYIICRFYQK